MSTEKPKRVRSIGNSYSCCMNHYVPPGKRQHAITCSNHKHRKGLKPCPFCQEPAEILPQAPRGPGLKRWLVRCTSCQCRMEVFSKFLPTVRAAWNYRKEPEAVSDSI